MSRPRLACASEGYIDIRFLEAFAEAGELTLLIPAQDYDGSGLAARVARSGFPVEVVRLPSPRPLAVLAILWQLLRRWGRHDAVVSLDVRGGALAAGLACRLTGTPLLAYVFTDPVAYWRCRDFPGPWGGLRRALGAAVLGGMLRADILLASRVLGIGSAFRGLPWLRTGKAREVNLYGVTPRWHQPAEPSERPRLREELGLPRDPPLILFSSRVAPEKDTGTLLEAARRLAREGVPFTLLNASGQHREFEAAVRAAGLEGRALARPPVHPVLELPAYYRASDLCVQASRAEGFGWSPREALACGTPVVVADVGGMRGDFEGMGLSYPAGDAAALADRIREALSDPGRMRAMAARGRAYVLERYDRDRAVAALAAAIEEVRG